MHAANQALRWMLGNAGASLAVLLLGHVPCSAPTHALPPRWVVQGPQCCPNSGTRQGRLHRHSLELVPFPLTVVTPRQQGVAPAPCLSLAQQIHLHSSPSTAPAPLPPALCCGPDSYAATSLPSITRSFCV